MCAICHFSSGFYLKLPDQVGWLSVVQIVRQLSTAIIQHTDFDTGFLEAFK